MNVPNMCYEILDAIHAFYNDEDVETDCLLYLANLGSQTKMVHQLSDEARKELNGMGRCEHCGTPLETHQYQEIHTEVDDNQIEEMYVRYCPNCDLDYGMDKED